MFLSSFSIRLSLQKKFFLSIFSYVVAVSVVGILSYDDLVTIRQQLAIVEEMQLIANDLLEARRFEKNFLLYGNRQDLFENRSFIGKAESSVQELDDLRLRSDQKKLLESVKRKIAQYKTAMNSLENIAPGTQEAPLESIRLYGKEIVDASERLLADETTRIRATINDLMIQLAVAIAVALVLGVFAAYLMFGKLFNALRVINTATKRIAKGVFEPLPEVGDQDEAQSIVRALNAMVRELEVRQDQLVQAKKLTSLGTLTAGIAHQLNNPLNNISTSSQIALEDIEGCDTDFMRRMLTNIESETVRAKEIVQGLLEFSREKSFALSTVRLKDVVEKTLRLVMSQVPANVRIETDISDDVVLDMDVQRMQEVLLNLIINAVHAIAPADGVVTLRAGQGNGNAELQIIDTGKGIPKDVVDKIFDPFFTTKGDVGGTGLGLSIVYGVIKRHKGSISVQSAPGKGTTFSISLPLNRENLS